MEKMEVRVSLKKRVLVTLIPLMCMVGVILDASLELFMEYSPLLDAIERDIFFLILGGAILSIPFIIKRILLAGFSACGGSHLRHCSTPPQCDPRGAFFM